MPMDARIAPIALVVAAALDRLASIDHNDRVISQSGGHIECNRCSGRPSSAAVTEMRRLRTYAAPNMSVEQELLTFAFALVIQRCR